MWVEEVEEFFKGYLPYYVLIFVPIFLLISPINHVTASHEFPVYRMQHYDLHGVAHGCRSATLNLEARSLTGWTTSRHCVITRLQDLTVDHFHNIRSKAGALLVVLPRDLSALGPDERQHLLSLEVAMMAQEVSIPVYFLTTTPELEGIVSEVEQNLVGNDLKKSALETLFGSMAANGYQLVVTPGTVSQKKDMKVATVQGQLLGTGKDGKVATIAVVAHYDTFGIAPDLSFGADSNGSGVVILLELIRVFSTLYSKPKTRGSHNIVFLLTGGGKINYQGSKKWLEDIEVLDGSIIQEAKFVLCLDTLGSGESLYMHVSKPPKEGSAGSQFFKELKGAAEQYSEVNVEGIHKKINLADDMLAWEHERFSIRRLPAFTLSTLKSHRDLNRGTILDTKSNLNMDRMVKNAKILAEALATHIYNVSGNIFGGTLNISESHMGAWLDFLTTQPRSPQLLSGKDNSLVISFRDNFNQYLKDVKISYASPEKRDPDFLFYGSTKGMISVYSVKPAIFDLVLTFIIIAYLGVVYLIVQKFSLFYNTACKLTDIKNKKR